MNVILFTVLFLVQFSSVASAQVEAFGSNGLLTKNFDAVDYLENLLGGGFKCEKASLAEVNAVDQCLPKVEILSQINQKDLDLYSESLIFYEATRRAQRIGQCQSVLFDGISVDSPDAMEFRKNGWAQFSYLHEQISGPINSYIEADTEYKEFKNTPSNYQDDRLAGVADDVARHRESLREKMAMTKADVDALISRIPLGNRPQMKEELFELFKKRPAATEEEFNVVYNRGINKLKKEAHDAKAFFEKIEHKIPNTPNSYYEIDEDLKKSMTRSGQVANVIQSLVNDKTLSTKYAGDIMCRAEARYIVGSRNLTLVEIPTYFLGAYGLGRAALAAGVRVIRAGSAMALRSAQVMRLSSQVATLGLESYMAYRAADTIRESCIPQDFITSAGGESCSFESEIQGAYQEALSASCVTNALVSAGPLFLMNGARFIGWRKAAAAVRAEKKLAEPAPKVKIVSTEESKRVIDSIVKGKETDDAFNTFGFKRQPSSFSQTAVYAHSNGSKVVLPQGATTLTKADKAAIEEVIINTDTPVTYTHKYSLTSESVDSVRLAKIPQEDIDFIRVRVGNQIEDPKVRDFVMDELRFREDLTPLQKKQKLEKLAITVKNWDQPTNLLNRTLASMRAARLERDAEKFSVEMKKSNPHASDDLILTNAQKAAYSKRNRVVELRRQCSSMKANPSNATAGKYFAAYSSFLGVASTSAIYSLNHWDEIKDFEWGSKLGFEVVMSFMMSRWGAKITSQANSTPLQKYTKANLLSLKNNIFEAGVYQKFFGNDDEKARAEFDKIASSPDFESNIQKLQDYIENKSHMDEVIDGVGDFSNNFARAVSGNPGVTDLSEAQLKNLRPEDLKNPNVQEKLMDLIDDQLQKEQTVTGNAALDRLGFNTTYNLAATPVTLTVGVLTFRAVCMNLDNPAAAFGAFVGLQGARQLSTGHVYYKTRKEMIDQ